MSPLTAKGEKILGHMEEQYGPKKGKEVLYASKNAGVITGIDGLPADETYAEAGTGLSLAELNANNRRFWEQKGGQMYPNLGMDAAVVQKETSTSMPNPTPPAGTVKGPVFSAAVPEKPLGDLQMGAKDEVETIFKAQVPEKPLGNTETGDRAPQEGSWDRLFGKDQGEPDEHEHPENEEIIEEAIEPGIHKRVAQVHKASQGEGEDTEFDEDGVMTNDPHGYKLKADSSKAKDFFPEMMREKSVYVPHKPRKEPPKEPKKSDDCAAGEIDLPFGGCRKLHRGEKAPPKKVEGENITRPFGEGVESGYSAYMAKGGVGRKQAKQEVKAAKHARKLREKARKHGGAEAQQKAWAKRHAAGDDPNTGPSLNVMPRPTVRTEIGKSTTAVAKSVRMKPLGA